MIKRYLTKLVLKYLYSLAYEWQGQYNLFSVYIFKVLLVRGSGGRALFCMLISEGSPAQDW